MSPQAREWEGRMGMVKEKNRVSKKVKEARLKRRMTRKETGYRERPI